MIDSEPISGLIDLSPDAQESAPRQISPFEPIDYDQLGDLPKSHPDFKIDSNFSLQHTGPVAQPSIDSDRKNRDSREKLMAALGLIPMTHRR